MKCIIMFLASILLAVSSNRVLAQETPAQWVKKLGSGSYPERERAAAMLVKVGPAALPALREASESADLETRRRAVRLIDRIEDNQLLIPTPIALRFQSEPARTAMRRAGEQMGFPVLVLLGGEHLVDLDTGPMPYWRAWKRVREAAQLREGDWAIGAKLKAIDDAQARTLLEVTFLRPPYALQSLAPVDPRMELTSRRPTDNAFVEDDGSGVRVRVRWKSLSKELHAEETCAVFAVEVRPEPRLEFAALSSVEITKIVDADGTARDTKAFRTFSTPANPQDTPILAAFSGEVQFNGLLHQKAIYWQGPARPLKELHGRVRLAVVARSMLMEGPGVVNGPKEVRGPDGITLKVLEAEADEDDRQIHLQLRLSNLESLTPQTDEQKYIRVRPGLVAVRGAIDVALERLRLRDAKGWLHQALPSTEYKEVEKGIYEASVHFATPAGNLDDFRLVLTKAAKTVTFDMPFQVRDVPAPRVEGK